MVYLVGVHLSVSKPVESQDGRRSKSFAGLFQNMGGLHANERAGDGASPKPDDFRSVHALVQNCQLCPLQVDLTGGDACL